MTTDKLMKICKVSKLNRTQLDEMRRYNKNQRNIFKAEIILATAIVVLKNNGLEIVLSCAIGILLCIELRNRLLLKKKILTNSD